VVKIAGRQVSLGRERAAALAKYHRLMASQQDARVMTVGDLVELHWAWLKRERAETTCDRRGPVLKSFGTMYKSLPVEDLRPHHANTWVTKTYPNNNSTSIHTNLSVITIMVN
jgi:hypothetical protein